MESTGNIESYVITDGERGKPAVVRVQVDPAGEPPVEFVLTSDDAVNIGLKLLSDAWQAKKWELGEQAEIFRKLGFRL